MDLLKVILYTILLTANYAINIDAAFAINYIEEDGEPKLIDDGGTVSLRGLNRVLAQNNVPQSNTCDKFPGVCRMKSSAGPDCCKKKCVNVKTDRLNCGMCGHKCKYNEICCKGKCVNVLSDQKNCGGCQNKCKKGELCAYGMCNYA